MEVGRIFGWLQDYHTIKMHIEKLVKTQAHHDQGTIQQSAIGAFVSDQSQIDDLAARDHNGCQMNAF